MTEGDLTRGDRDASLDLPEVVDGQPAPDSRLPPGARIIVRQGFSGPIPPPEILAQYNDALPDGANRIMKMAEDQSAHRRHLESRGQIFGFLLALVAILGGVGLILDGRSVEGLVPLIGALAGLAGVFVYGEWRAHGARRVTPPSEGAKETDEELGG